MSASLLVGLGGLIPGQVAAAQASSGRTLVVGDTSSVQKLDPDVVTNFLDFQALGLIYDQLVQYNTKLQLVPDLATSWAYSDGNKLLTFQLRKGVTFDDGSTLHVRQRRRLARPGARPQDRRRLGVVPGQRQKDRGHRHLHAWSSS